MPKVRLLAIALLSATVNAELLVERDLDDGPSFSAYVVSYESSGLTVRAMVAVPNVAVPHAGFPVVIANHGYVPDPRKYGITEDGRDSRPGDYYRSVPEMFASRGFLVVLPDYRGHNDSEGFEQIVGQAPEAIHDIIAMYAADVSAVLPHLESIESADTDRVFMWSHSMGGGVSIQVLLDSNIVKASSFWSTMDVDYLKNDFSRISEPVLIHHARGDATTSCENSALLARNLRAAGNDAIMLNYDSDDHFFHGDVRELAADRDAEFFLGKGSAPIEQSNLCQ